MDIKLKQIAHYETNLSEKFGLPRQAGLVPQLKGKIVFEKEYNNKEAFRGLEEFSHIWVLWAFSENIREEWSPTVRPPRLGGNKRIGVFATRSPFRPNPIGLSCLQIEKVDLESAGSPAIHVLGGDLMDGTPIYDIKPYIPYADSVPDAKASFASTKPGTKQVDIPPQLAEKLGDANIQTVKDLLAQDPRPAYIKNGERIFGLSYGKYQIRFYVENDIIHVNAILED